MTTADLDVHDEVVVTALADLREARRRRRLGQWNVIDALYRAYLTAIGGGLAVTLLSGVVGDDRVTGAALSDVREVGPAVVGAAVAFALGVGLRSGARGGPLALEAAEVRYVLLAPVDRDVALRQPALRLLRFAAFAGTVTGAAVGLLAYRRLPGAPLGWIAAGAAVGLATAVAAIGVAMVASGKRVGRRMATAASLALLAWSAADMAGRRATSPASLLGQVGLWPFPGASSGQVPRPLGWVGLAGAAALAVAGVFSIGGMSLEAAERRGRLVTHLRFAATFQDLRTVMLLRRQLSAEVPRPTPWVRLRPAGRGPIAWRRDWRGILRWPATRFARLAALGVVAGLATAGAWAGTTPLVLLAGGALFVAALDATEGLAQEVDHPDLSDSFPLTASALHLRHLAAPTVVLSGVTLIGVAAAAAISGAVELTLRVGLPLALPAAAAAAGAAAVSTLRGPPDPARLLADATGLALLFRHALPPLLATAAPAAVLLVHSQLRSLPGSDPAALAASAAVNVTMLVVLIFGWVRQREAIAGLKAGEGMARVGG